MDSTPNTKTLGQAQKSVIQAMLKDSGNYLWVKETSSVIKRFVRNTNLMLVVEVSEQTFTPMLDRKILIKFKEGESYKVYRLNNKIMQVDSFAVKK